MEYYPYQENASGGRSQKKIIDAPSVSWQMNKKNIYFWLRFGLTNAVNNYSRLEKCVANF